MSSVTQRTSIYDGDITVPNPESSTLDYEITKAPEHETSRGDGLVDVSGSMQKRTEVPQLQC